MNDAALSKYYYGSSYQHADLSTPIHSWGEHDTPNLGSTYVNSNCVGSGFLEDEQTFFHNNIVQPQSSQNELLAQEQLLPPEIFKESTTCSENSTPTSNTLVDIPFVQIHTTNLEPPDKSYHNVFRRKAEPIKAEPIKSETTDSGKERVNSTPTPPARISNYSSLEGKTTIEVENNIGHAATQSMPSNLQKCSACPFISLSHDCLSNHVATVHAAGAVGNFRPSILCPGCENIFYSFNSFELHLREDHLMVPDEASSIIYDLQNELNLPQSNVPVQAVAETKNKNMLFVKDVNCLRVPQEGERVVVEEEEVGEREDVGGVGPIEQQTQNNLENINFELHSNNNVFNLNQPVELSDSSTLRPKQMISIKSVDVRCDPGFVQRPTTYPNYSQMDPANQNHNNNTNNNSNFSENNLNKNYINDEPANEAEKLENIERPRRAKIHKKNVDILKEPIQFPRHLNFSNIQNMSFNFGTQNITSGSFQSNSCVDMPTVTTCNGFENTLPTITNMNSQQSYLFDNNIETSRSGRNTNNINADFLENTIIVNHNFTLDNTRFVGDLDIGFDYLNSASISNLPIVADSTLSPMPMPLPTAIVSLSSNPDADHAQMPMEQTKTPLELTIPKQENFIKNVDILKAPQVHLGQQHQKGTLHLRTVDELNLMNRNEVENLMAPNHQAFHQEQINVTADHALQSTDVDDISVSQLSDFVKDFPNSWSNDLGDLDCIITDSIGPLLNKNKSDETTLDQSELQNKTNADGCPQQGRNNTMPSICEIEDLFNEDFATLYNLPTEQMQPNSTKEEINFRNAIPRSIQTSNMPVTTSILGLAEMPPLAPVRATSGSNGTDTSTLSNKQNLANIYVPPLVPLSSKKDYKPKVNNSQQQQLSHIPLSDRAFDLQTLDNNNGQRISQPCYEATIMHVTVPVDAVVKASAPLQFQQQQQEQPQQQTVIEGSQMSIAEEINTSEEQSVDSRDKTAKIYVVNNLQKDSGDTEYSPDSSQDSGDSVSSQSGGVPESSNDLVTRASQNLAGGTSVRGRPYGARRTGITKLRKQHGAAAESQVGVKCSVNNCAFRFKESETLAYHKRCHVIESNSLHSMICPECNSTDFSNWNSLHTHLWRSHKVDMELYKCPLCDFRTPIYSRLLNTHSKIHFEERNYKCDQCGKGFKNSKQLKNHRRWHRNPVSHLKPGTQPSKSTKPKLHPCVDCGTAFSYIHTLREHLCKNRDEQIQCEVCKKPLSSKSSLKLHMLKHSKEKRFKCGECNYETSDHNAFRRHCMVHKEESTYSCPHCDCKFIQSSSYQRHICQKHPEQAAEIVFKCTLCGYTTINRSLLTVHIAKHECISATKKDKNKQQNQPLKDIPSVSNDINTQLSSIHTNCETTVVHAAALPLQQQHQQQQQVLVPESAQIPQNPNGCSGYVISKNESKKQFHTDAFQIESSISSSIEQHQGQSVQQVSQILG